MKSLWGELYKFTWIIWRITSLDCLGQSAPPSPLFHPKQYSFATNFVKYWIWNSLLVTMVIALNRHNNIKMGYQSDYTVANDARLKLQHNFLLQELSSI